MLLPESHVFRGGTFVWVGDLSRSIQLLYLNQPGESIVGYLTDGHVCKIGDDTRVSCCWHTNASNYFM